MGDPEDYSIAREGVWGREGAGIPKNRRAGGFFFGSFFVCFFLAVFRRSSGVSRRRFFAVLVPKGGPK